MLSGVSAECGVRGTVEGDMGESDGDAEGTGEDMLWTG